MVTGVGGLQPRVTTCNPRIDPPFELLVHCRGFPDPANPTSNLNTVSTRQQDTQVGRRQATHGHQ